MGKKVILMNDFSTKFDFLPYPPVRYSGDLNKDIQKAIKYPNALLDCRIKNQKFFKERILPLFSNRCLFELYLRFVFYTSLSYLKYKR